MLQFSWKVHLEVGRRRSTFAVRNLSVSEKLTSPKVSLFSEIRSKFKSQKLRTWKWLVLATPVGLNALNATANFEKSEAVSRG